MMRVKRKWQWSTTLTKKSAILALFNDPTVITKDRLFIKFIAAGNSDSIQDQRNVSHDITPILEFFRTLPPNEDLSAQQINMKLCWLIGICGFMRADDVQCIDIAQSDLNPLLVRLAVVFPKELRGSQRIIKHITIKPHPDPALCPVQVLLAYVQRIVRPWATHSHPKDKTYKIVPLVRQAEDYHVPVSAAWIRALMNQVTNKMLPAGRVPSTRALGSTLAAVSGVPITDIMVQGNWSSPRIFEKHYCLSSSTSSNFSTSTLGPSGSTY